MKPFIEVNRALKELLGSLSQYSADNEPALEGVHGEVALWRAVLMQALLDAASGSLHSTPSADRANAIHWLLDDRHHFPLVCDLAALDPAYVRDKARAALSGTLKRQTLSTTPYKALYTRRRRMLRPSARFTLPPKTETA